MLIVYSLIGCPYSEAAEQLIQEYNIKHKLIKVSRNEKEEIKKMNNMQTFPQIFLDKTLIGGYDNLQMIIQLYNNIKHFDGINNKDKYKKMINDTSNKLKLHKKILHKIIHLINI
jgi:glutaredoxin